MPPQGEHPLGTRKGLAPRGRRTLGNRVEGASRTIPATISPGSGKRSGDAIAAVGDSYLRAVCEACVSHGGRIHLILGVVRFCRKHGVVGIGLHTRTE